MPKAHPIQNNFTAGELSPRLLGRTDISKYFNGCAILENFKVHPHGGATVRPGTHFAAPTKDHTKQSCLVPFVFSDEQAYMLEFGDQYIRFYRDGGQILGPSNKVTNGAFPTNINFWDDVSSGTGAISHDGVGNRLSLDAGGSGTTNQAAAEQDVALTKAGDLVSISFDTATDGVRFIVGTATGTIDVFDSGELSAGSHQYSVIAASDPLYIGFYYAPDSAGSAYVDNVELYEPYEINTSYLEAELFELQNAQSADVMWITHRNHKTQKLTRTGHSAWTIGNWTPTGDPFTGAGNYPRAVTFYQQRLYVGGTANAPSKFWGTEAGNYGNIAAGTADGDPFAYVVASGSGKVPVINWMRAGDVLFLGCTGTAFQASGGNNYSITPTNVDVKEASTKGVSLQRAEIIDKTAVYVNRSNRKLLQMGYKLEIDGYDSDDVAILSEHITIGGIKQMGYQQDPDSIIWSARNDGQLLGTTYEKPQDVIAWDRHILGGSFSGGNAVVESVATIPSSAGDQVWLIVKRTINGSTVRYVEYMDEESWREMAGDTTAEILTKQKYCFYVDSGLTYNGAATTTIRGLDHLIGEEVAILADGANHPRKTVDSLGQITLDYAASIVHVGLPYQATLKTLPVGIEGTNGTVVGKYKGWSDVTVLLHESLGGTINGEEHNFRKDGDPMDSPPPLYTGTITVDDIGYDDTGQITIQQNLPLPLTVLAITGNLQVNE